MATEFLFKYDVLLEHNSMVDEVSVNTPKAWEAAEYFGDDFSKLRGASTKSGYAGVLKDVSVIAETYEDARQQADEIVESTDFGHYAIRDTNLVSAVETETGAVYA